MCPGIMTESRDMVRYRSLLSFVFVVALFFTADSAIVFGNAQTAATDLFALVDLNRSELASVKAKYNSGQYSAALDEFRDIFLDRMAGLDMGTLGWERSTADDLMTNTVYIYNQNSGYEVQNIGAPGSINWFLITSYDWWEYWLSNMSWCNNLIVAFAGNPQNNGAYLQKWAAFWDDFATRNYNQWAAIYGTPQQAQYGPLFANIWLHGLVIADRTNYLFAQIAQAAAADVTYCKNNIPSEQLAHILTMMAGRNLPKLNSVIGGVPNQVITEAKALMRAGIGMEQFKDASTWLATGQYNAENYLHASYMIDGSDMEQSFNYNATIIDVGMAINSLFQSAGMTLPDWVTEYSVAMRNRFRFMLSIVRPNRMMPGLDLSSDKDAGSIVTSYQGYLQDVLAQQINNHIWGMGTGAEPAFTSIAFPFGGFYIIRDGWDANSNHLFMKGSRMGKGHMDESGNQIQVTAYGRTMLIDSGGSYAAAPQYDYRHYSFGHNTIIVDGKSQCMGGEHSPAYNNTVGTRWHSSNQFDFIEGVFGSDLGSGYGNGSITISGVTHRREVIFLRQQKLYLVIDRIKSSASHTYKQIWNFDPTYAESEVSFTGNKSIITQDNDGANVAIYNFTTSPLTYNKYYGYVNGTEYLGWYTGGTSYMPAVDTHVVWNGTGNQVLVTVIRPMALTDDGITSVIDTSSETSRGFEIVMDSGAVIKYQARLSQGSISIDNITVNGDSLLTVTTGGVVNGMVFGCSSMNIAGQGQFVKDTNFEFEVTGTVLSAIIPISTPATFRWVEDGENIHPIYVGNRAVDWDAATNKFVAGTNYHGTVDDPNGGPGGGSYWSYHWQSASPDYGGSLTTLNTGIWQNLDTNLNYGGFYGISLDWPIDRVIADRDHFDAFWHNPESPMDRRPAWTIAVWHPVKEWYVSLDGVLRWQLGYWAGAYVQWSIGKLSHTGTYTPLLEGSNGSSTLPIGTITDIGDLGDVAALQNVELGDGESIVFGFCGPNYNYRLGTFYDDAVTITVSGCVSVPADFNGDCMVDFLDFAIFADQWLEGTE